MSARKTLLGTTPLRTEDDLAASMVAGIDRFLGRETEAARQCRILPSGDEDRQAARQRLAEIVGAIDERKAPSIDVVAPAREPVEVASGPNYKVLEVRWPVLHGVDGEGLLLQPTTPPIVTVIALPDCDATPEQFMGLEPGVPESAQVPRRLAESGCRVLVPLLMDRRCTYSGHPDVKMTNQPHREFIYRCAYEVGRHIIGYEIQKVLAGVDALADEDSKIGLFGHGEGGLLAFYAAALDDRVRSAVVSGYFGPRESLWSEPIYRNLFGILRDYGDAEIAAGISPRTLIIEAANHPEISGPPGETSDRLGAAPGRLTTPAPDAALAEFDRAKSLSPTPGALHFVSSADGLPGCDTALSLLLRTVSSGSFAQVSPVPLTRHRLSTPSEPRFKRQFDQLVDHTQHALREAEFRRAEYWPNTDCEDLADWQQSASIYRERLWNDVIGPLPSVELPPNPRTRLCYEDSRLTAYEVVLDVFPDVFAYGILLVPKRIRKGAQRPVVVCQHGLEGRAQKIVDPDGPRHPYRNFAYDLAREGFVTYAPQNPYIGGDAFRLLQRKANPLKLSLFSFIVRQHEQTLAWLSSLPYVDPDRIGFYGISYGGKTAMRVPALVEQYALSTCSADFNEWIWKNASSRHRHSYVFTGKYEMFEFNLGNTFNYAEMTRLICPRPFMVERGHHDGVAPDEWVAYEYAKARRPYVMLGLQDRIQIEYFNGPHTINGEGTFAFLRKHLT